MEIRPFVGEDTVFLSVLNGVTSEEMVDYMGYISLGTKDGKHNDMLDAVCSLLERCGPEYDIPQDIRKQMWSKLMINTGINQVTAVYRAPYALVQQDGIPRKTMIRAMKEVQMVARMFWQEEVQKWSSLRAP